MGEHALLWLMSLLLAMEYRGFWRWVALGETALWAFVLGGDILAHFGF